MSEGIAFYTIFPFISQMIYDTGQVKEADVGFYLGIVESCWSITQMLCMVRWGKLVDRPGVGRKPVLVISLIGESICVALFGLCTTIWQMVLLRCCAGVFAGMVVTVRTMIAENSDPKTQAQSFGWFAFSGNLGIIFGPIVGGFLAKPAEEYPWLFKGINFFTDHPFALSTFFAGSIGLFVAFVMYCALERDSAES